MRVYALLELGIAAFGIIALFGVPLVGRIYVAGATSGLVGLVLRGAVAAVCLLPPTVLMGASLPAIARSVETTPKGVSRLGFLYSANVAGAVFGCLFAGFYLLRVHDMGCRDVHCGRDQLGCRWARVRACGLHAARDRRRHRIESRPSQPEALTQCCTDLRGDRALGHDGPGRRGGVDASALLAARGDCLHVLHHSWRCFCWDFGPAAALARFLFARSTSAPPAKSGASRLPDPARGCHRMDGFHSRARTALIGLSILGSQQVPGSISIWISRAACAPSSQPRCCGAPASRLHWQEWRRMARIRRASPDRVYAVNTAGSILGALAFSLLLIPSIGTRGSQELLIWLAAGSAVIALASAAVGMRNQIRALTAVGAVAATVLVAWGLAATVSDVPWQAIAYGRRIAPILNGLDVSADAQTTPLFVGRGHQFIGGNHPARRSALLLRQRKIGSVIGPARHAPSANDGTYPGPAESRTAIGAGGWVWRRCYGRFVCSVPGRPEHRDLRIGRSHPTGLG